MKKLTFPLKNKSVLLTLRAGELLTLDGIIYTARDMAHYKMIESLKKGEKLPIELTNNAIYYCGPTPPKDDKLFGSAGPTTSARMDEAFIFLAKYGLSVTIGKGNRSKDVIKSCQENQAVYLITFGGAGAYLAKRIINQKLIAFPELGTEAIYELEVKDFPVIVAIDTDGNNIF
ncbi:MAG: FumA C-terminus/TtdB family hydratase beta subunit [Brevinematales bacterium]|nr:FumA C-terminus/TtdB family hydratase beta subunit [Brevinematales bacterium]